MEDRAHEDSEILLAATAEVVAAYVGHNTLNPTDLPKVIASVYQALRDLGGTVEVSEPAELVPAVSVRKSVTPDHITCLEDGKKFRSIKRHLDTAHHMTPEQYRQKWSLPESYPMIAANYSAKRSELAKGFGLGRKPVEVEAVTKPRRKTTPRVA